MSVSKTLKRLSKTILWKLQPKLFYKLIRRNGSVFSIGIFTGDTPFGLEPHGLAPNPVLSYEDVTDRPAAYVADPFMYKVDGQWHMLFEVLSEIEHRGLIGSATSNDGFHWTYNKIVLSEPFHLAYPYVFEWRGAVYMIPDSVGNGIRLYEAANFPDDWRYIKTLLDGELFVDSSIFEFKQRWWLLTASSPTRTAPKSLHCFYAESPLGPWHKHPESPVVKSSNSIARPGGRVLVIDGRPIRFAQDGVPHYGTSVRAFKIRELTTDCYKEEEASAEPILSGGESHWNSQGMHHVDAHPLSDGTWIACVDGWFSR
jgi:hypothetical protein